MTTEVLRKANDLRSRIRSYKKALECFEYSWSEGNKINVMDLNPKLAIEHDDADCRYISVLPDVLTKDFIVVIKEHIKTKIVELEKEFEAL